MAAKRASAGAKGPARTAQPKRRRDWKPAFLAALAASPNVTGAAGKAKIGVRTAYDHRERSPEFAAEWDAAIDSSTDSLVGEAYRRAFDGSDTLAIFLLKCHRPKVYADKSQVDLTSKGGKLGPVLFYVPDNGRD